MSDPAWQVPIPGLRLLIRPSQPIRRIQVYGQRCSGTHAIIKLVEGNFGPAAFTEVCGFKHWFVPPQILFAPDILVLTIARHPHDWLQSLHRQPWHAHPDLKTLPFAEFIRAPWHSYWDDEFWGVHAGHPAYGVEMMHERDPATGLRFANPVVKRTAKLRQWSGLHDRAWHLALLSFDTLQARPDAVIAALADATGLPVQNGFVPVETYKGHGHKPFAARPRVPLDPADAAHVDRWLDPAVEARFGFGPFSPVDDRTAHAHLDDRL